MTNYLVECSYTPQALAALIKQPQNRLDTAIKPLIEKAGGRVTNGWFSGNTDRHVIFVAELPNTVTTATISYAVEATGALRDLRITPLLSPDEFVESLRKASTLNYHPPGA